MILAIESTCDETAAAVVRGDQRNVEVLSNVVASSSEMHEKYGGIVPEVAAREQVMSILPVVKEALEKANISSDEIEAVAVAYGPGLIGSLLIGVETAKALAFAWNKPLLGVNHMEGHILANWITGDKKAPELPAIALVVSGGHTDLIYMKSIAEWEWLGGTRDDAAGECFDKCARILGLPYPGGPSIQKAAEMAKERKIERLPRPMLDQDSYDMSFSGLKSAVSMMMNELKDRFSDKEVEEMVPDLAREINEAVVEVLTEKTMKVVRNYQVKSVLLAGGVAANKLLREELKRKVEMEKGGIELFMPEMKYCTDNAAMIGAAALLRPNKVNILELRPEPGMEVV